MATPNVQVLEAIVESYLNSRLAGWGIDPENVDPDNLNSNTRHKLDVCRTAIASIRKASSEKDWVETCDTLYNLEVKEKESVKGAYFASQPVLELTLRALRSYILSGIENGNSYDKAIKDNTANGNAIPAIDHERLHAIDKGELSSIEDAKDMLDMVKKRFNHIIETRTLAALRDYPADLKNYHATYFTKVTLANDPKAKTLHEQTFTDFEQSVNKGDRKAELCDKLLAGDVLTSTHTETAEPSTAERNAKTSPLQTHSHYNTRQSSRRTSTQLSAPPDNQYDNTSRRRHGRRHN